MTPALHQVEADVDTLRRRIDDFSASLQELHARTLELTHALSLQIETVRAELRRHSASHRWVELVVMGISLGATEILLRRIGR